ncbi:MAG: serine hydrolase domain-containing protein [Balneolales bacterium]
MKTTSCDVLALKIQNVNNLQSMTAHSANAFFAFFTLFLLSCSNNQGSKHIIPEVGRIVSESIGNELIPGAVVLIASGDEILHHEAYGHAKLMDAQEGRLDGPEKMTTGHLFDLASLTKVLATTYGIMILEDQRKISVDDPISLYIPDFATKEKESITIRHLLSHTSGLMQWFPTYYVASDKFESLSFLADKSLDNPIGESRNYSDHGFMLLGNLIETVSETTLDQFLDEHLYQPLNLKHTTFNPSVSSFLDIASTSHGNPFEKRMVYDDDFGYQVDVDPGSWNGWRSHTLRGEVSDANAFHTYKGVAGHAGLFSTASDIHRLLLALLDNRSAVVSDSTIAKFTTPDRFGHGLGWMMEPISLNSPDLPSGSFGHTGFTGTNILVIPKTEEIIIVLTNRQNLNVLENGQYPNLREMRKQIISTVLDR